MKYFEKAIVFATVVHFHDVDKVGAPYILHPMRVALAMTTDTERAVAMLHDVIEDHPEHEKELVTFFPAEIVDAVRIVSRTKTETYAEFIKRIKASGSELAIKVKLADLRDNLSRINSLPEEMRSIEKRYNKAYLELTA